MKCLAIARWTDIHNRQQNMTMKESTKSNARGSILFAVAIAFGLRAVTASAAAAANDQSSPPPNATPGAKHSANPSSKYPPAAGFEKFAIIDTPKFYQTQSFTVSDTSKGYVKNVQFNYVYQDGRFAKVHSYDTDVILEVYEFASADKAQAYLKKKLVGAIPEAKASSVKLPPCKGQKRANDNFTGPNTIATTFHHPNGSEVVVMHSGDYNMWDCQRGNNRDEYVRWTDGVYYFEVHAQPNRAKDDKAYGRAEEFALDYLAALGQPVKP